MKKSMFAVVFTAAFAALALPTFAQGNGNAKEEEGAIDAAEQAKAQKQQQEARAKRMLANAVSLIKEGEDERATGMLEAIPRMFPESPLAFNAQLELGRYWLDKRQFDRAAASLRSAFKAQDKEVQAESMLLLGQVQIERADVGEAAMTLRRVTQDYPTSIHANTAFYLLGQLHFEAGRWARAVEAFGMVGTAVPETKVEDENGELKKAEGPVLTEAGQRIYVHVTDKDLAVLEGLGEHSEIEVVSKSGDKEKATLEAFGRGDGDYLASVLTISEPSQPYDGKLTVQGSEEIQAFYIDMNTEDGSLKKQRIANAKIVSTATLAFMDGALRQRTRAVFADQPAFIRLRDLDLDLTPDADTATVSVASKYRERPPAVEGAEPPPPDPDAPWIERDRVEVKLTETEARSGIFVGRLITRLTSDDTNAPPVNISAGELAVMQGDRIVAEYEDKQHLGGDAPEQRAAEATVVVGGSTEPQSIIAHSSDATIQARKLLLEAQLLHKWGNIFKEVGLDSHAAEKAAEGLERVAELMALATRFSLPREILEETFAAKWDLQLVQGNLTDAIATCRALVKLFPDTMLADRAFMQIGNARMQNKDDNEALTSAIQVYNSILQLPSSPLKAEAQFRIGQVIEMQVQNNLRPGENPDFSRAMVAYKRCADAYPESSFAGDSFKKVIDYYLRMRDYTRCVETLDRVFQDYPDAPWLDEMLLKWGVVLHRMGNGSGALEKFQRLVEEYPGGQAARQATAFIQRLSN